MSRLLFVLPAVPLVSDHSGAASRYTQNYDALIRIGREVHVIRIGTPEALESARRFERGRSDAQVRGKSATTWRDEAHTPTPRSRSTFGAVGSSLRDPVEFEFADTVSIGDRLRPIIEALKPEVLWVEGTELGAAVARLRLSVPWILSNHDVLHRARRVRVGGGRFWGRWRLTTCRRAEERVMKMAPCVITGSVTDAERLRAMGCRRVEVINVAKTVLVPFPKDATPVRDARIVHLGSLETTANRIGLEAYLRRVHRPLLAECRMRGVDCVLWVIGDHSRAREPLASRLRSAEIRLTGFIDNISGVLRPFDIAILPYEHDTGYRTKVPVLFEHGQAVVATAAAVAGVAIEGFRDVCMVLKDLDDFPATIARLAGDPAARERLGLGARRFAERHFTLGAVQERYQAVLEATLGVREAACREGVL